MRNSAGTHQPAIVPEQVSARDGPGTVGGIPGALSAHVKIMVKIKLGGLARRFTAY
jgi:hypothetical protein